MAKKIKATIFRLEAVFARSSPKCLSFCHVDPDRRSGETSQYSKTREILLPMNRDQNDIAFLLGGSSDSRPNRPGRKRSPNPAWSVCLVALAVAIIGLIFFKLGFHVTSATPAIVSLLYGFAPLIGLLFLQIIITLLYSLLICSVGRILADDDTPVPKPSRKAKLYHSNYLISKIALSLSLKEHSPPISPIPCY
jgi:hypothetical protein